MGLYRLNILAITLESGENEYLESKGSIELSASFYNGHVKHVVFSGLDRFDADTAVYTKIEDNRGKYFLFVKIDADMRVSANFFEKLNNYFTINQEVSHLVIPVYDVLSGSHIIGLHAYNQNVYWESLESKSDVYVDPDPKLVKGKHKIEKYQFKYDVEHCFNPSELQAYYYGLHRGGKFFSAGFNPKRISSKYLQFELVYLVRRNFFEAGSTSRTEELRKFFLLGFYHSKNMPKEDVFKILQKKEAFEKESILAPDTLFSGFMGNKCFWLGHYFASLLVLGLRKVILRR